MDQNSVETQKNYQKITNFFHRGHKLPWSVCLLRTSITTGASVFPDDSMNCTSCDHCHKR